MAELSDTSETEEGLNAGDLSPPPDEVLPSSSTEPIYESTIRNAGEANTKSISLKWKLLIYNFRQPILKLLHAISTISAQNPKITIIAVMTISVGLIMIGFVTNFTVDVDEEILWTPKNSKPVQHKDWIKHKSGFPPEGRPFYMTFHTNGGNVIGGKDQIRRVFQAVDVVRNVPGYESLCAQSYGATTCEIGGVTEFWNHSVDLFEDRASSDEEAVAALSAKTYPDGTPVDENSIFGHPRRDENDTLTFSQLYLQSFTFPEVDDAEEFEKKALDAILNGIRVEWQKETGNDFQVELNAERSFSDEFTRAIEDDIPLIPIVFVVMSAFTCSIFSKCHAVRSRSLLGFGGVVSVLFSIVSGYGLMFICGVPFTSMTPLLPFIIFGIGLDDTFIISGCYERTDKNKDVLERLYDTIEDCGLSITLTTITSAAAFGLGCISTVPAIFWLCLYAFPTVMLVLIYQLTFFVACIVLDERRVEENRRDCCFCMTVKAAREQDLPEEHFRNAESEEAQSHPSERFMATYVNLLLTPWVQVAVILGFIALGVVCALSASKLTQEFNFVDVLPKDSYVSDFFETIDEYSIRSGANPFVYFRFVDQSNVKIQEDMLKYVKELQEIDSIVYPPGFFWLEDFHKFIPSLESNATELTFNDYLDSFLADPVYQKLYADNIVRDPDSGSITASRVIINMDNVDFEDIRNQVDALEDQRSVTKAQRVNQGRKEWAFFTYDGVYDIWEFYSVSVDELIFTTIMGIVAVTGLTLLLVPHWTAAVFVLPLIMLLYVDLLGALQWAGAHINPVSYVALVLSIGLMVDFLMHMLLRYYESKGNRKEKTSDALRTMGASILLGGVSTFLGTLPLAFSTSEIFTTIFYAFLALVTLGCGHGLIFLPVLLSLFGPEDQPLQRKSWRTKATLSSTESA